MNPARTVYKKGRRFFEEICEIYDVGKITKFLNPTKYEFGFIADGTTWFSIGNLKTPRFLMFVPSYADMEDVSKQDKEALRKLNKKLFNPQDECISFHIYDLRVVRFLILALYEAWKYKSGKEVEAMMNKSVDWTQEKAGEWLRRNKIYGPGYENEKRRKYIAANRDFFSKFNNLPEPYWGLKSTWMPNPPDELIEIPEEVRNLLK